MKQNVIIALIISLVPYLCYGAYTTRVINSIHPLSTQMKEAHTKYVIKSDLFLTEDLVIPENCILYFDGGCIRGKYTLIGQNTCIQSSLVKIFDTDVILAGSWNLLEVYPEWFGAKNDGITDCSPAFNALINLCFSKGTDDISCIPIKLGKGVYILESPIILPFNRNQYVFRKEKEREVFKDWCNSFTLLGSGYMTTTLKAGKKNRSSLIASDNNKEQLDSFHRLKNIVIKDITFSGSFICPTCFDNWSTLQIYHNEFENVTFTEFSDVAVNVMRLGDEHAPSGQNSECNWRNVSFKYNNIGMKIDGASSSFYGCRWERNYYRGLVVTGFSTAVSFYESLIQYNVFVDYEYERLFDEHGIKRGEYPGNLIFENVNDAHVNFHGSYFEPSFDKVVDSNYAPIQILQNRDNFCRSEINIEDSYYNMFTDFIKLIRTDYDNNTVKNAQCYAANINLRNLKITRTNEKAFVLAFCGSYLTLRNSHLSVHNRLNKMGDAILDKRKNYDKLNTVFIDAPIYGPSNMRPNYLIGLGQTYYDTDLHKLLIKVEKPDNFNDQVWADVNGKYYFY